METISCFLTLNHTHLLRPYIKSINFPRDEGENKQNMLIFVLGCSSPLKKKNTKYLAIFDLFLTTIHLRIYITTQIFAILPQIYKGGSQTSYTTPCNGIISRGAQIRGIRIFADHTRGNKRKQNTSTIFARCVAFRACLSSRSDHSTYGPDESRLF